MFSSSIALSRRRGAVDGHGSARRYRSLLVLSPCALVALFIVNLFLFSSPPGLTPDLSSETPEEKEKENTAERRSKTPSNDAGYLKASPVKSIKVRAEIKSSNEGWDSTKCAVTGIGVGYGLGEFKPFVGSLRSTGYKGHIIIGVAEDAPSDLMKYLTSQNVTVKKLKMLPPDECTHYNITTADDGHYYNSKCFEAYPDYKITWGRFAITKDWIIDCKDCTDGIMLTDVRDAYFQSDPFIYKKELQKPLMVFEELYPNLTNTHWLTDAPVKNCKGITIGATPMLCSGSTMGSREGILNYIDAMKKEFDEWNKHESCRSNMVGDDQSIHNYLYYTGGFKDATAIPHRTGPIHVVGFQADKIFRAAIKKYSKKHNVDKHQAETAINNGRYYGDDTNWRQWLGPEHNLIDPKTGYILNLDGKASPQVHQFDRFGHAFSNKWYYRMNDDSWNK